jgi:hypothetical protein
VDLAGGRGNFHGDGYMVDAFYRDAGVQAARRDGL